MNIYLADIQGLGLVPVIYTSPIDNTQHYIGDYLTNYQIMPQGNFISLLEIPTSTNNLYLPVIAYINPTDNTVRSIIDDERLFNNYTVNIIDKSIADTLWDYLISLHSAVIADGVFQQFRIIPYNEFKEQFNRRIRTIRGEQQQPKQSEVEQKTQVTVQNQEENIQPEQHKVEEQTQEHTQKQEQEPVREQNIVGFGQQPEHTGEYLEEDEIREDSEEDTDVEVNVNYTQLVLASNYQTDLNNFNPTKLENGTILVTNTTMEQLEVMRNQVSNYAADRVYAPSFIPLVYRYENPVQITLPTDQPTEDEVNMSFNDFTKCIEAIQTKDLATLQMVNKRAYKLAVAIESRLCRGKVALKDFIDVFSVSSSSTLSYQLLYDLLKYYVSEESPNGLYDNIFILPYLMKVELTLRGIDQEEIDNTIKYIILSWCMKAKDLQAVESIDEADDLDDKGSETVYSFDQEEVLLAFGQTVLRNTINDTLLQDNVAFTRPVDTNLSVLRCICISAKYGISIQVADTMGIYPLLKLKGWEISLDEYSMTSTILGVQVSTYVITHMLSASTNKIKSILSNSKEQTEDQHANYVKDLQEILPEYAYNNMLDKLKASNFNPKEISELNYIPYVADYDMELTKVVVCTVGGRVKLLGVIASVNNVKELYSGMDENLMISYKYVFLPIGGSYLGYLLKNGIYVKGFLEKPEDLSILFETKVGKEIKTSYVDSRMGRELLQHKANLVSLGELAPTDINLSQIKQHINRFRGKTARDISYSKVKLLNTAKYDEEIINLTYSKIIK